MSTDDRTMGPRATDHGTAEPEGKKGLDANAGEWEREKENERSGGAGESLRRGWRGRMVVRRLPSSSLSPGLPRCMTPTDMVVAVASMIESDLGAESETTSYNAPGEPGQRHEVGKAFGC
jgi:hypothetical protein